MDDGVLSAGVPPGRPTAAIEVHDDPPASAAARVDAGLDAANGAAAPLHEVRPLGSVARAQDGSVVGGVIGRTWGACAEVQQVWVDAPWRRQGLATALLQAFHARAEARGCTTFYLETFSFQAPALYAALGYRERLAIDGFGHGIRKFVMVRERQ